MWRHAAVLADPCGLDSPGVCLPSGAHSTASSRTLGWACVGLLAAGRTSSATRRRTARQSHCRRYSRRPVGQSAPLFRLSSTHRNNSSSSNASQPQQQRCAAQGCSAKILPNVKGSFRHLRAGFEMTVTIYRVYYSRVVNLRASTQSEQSA